MRDAQLRTCEIWVVDPIPMASAIVCNVRCCRSNERLAVLVEKRSLRGIRGREEPRENGGQSAYVSVKAVGSKRNMMRASKIGWRGLRVKIGSRDVQCHSGVVG